MEAHADFLSGELRRNWPPLLCVTGPQPQRGARGAVGGGRVGEEADVPSHISCARMRAEAAPAFCSLPGREPTAPTGRHLFSRFCL